MWLKKNFELSDPLTALLVYTVLSQAVLYFILFVILPQSWSLIDDYGYVLDAKTSPFDPWQRFIHLNESLMNVGRFKPLAAAITILRLWLLPLKPAVFHGFQWLIAVGVHFFFFKMLRTLGFSFQKALLAVLIASFSFSVKDMVLFPTTTESLLLLFFFLSFWCFLKERYITAFFCFFLGLISKELGVCLLSLYFVYAAFFPKKRTRKMFLFLAAMTCTTLCFIIYVKSLPQVYTGGYDFKKFTFQGMLTAFSRPVLKNYGPVFLTLAWLFASQKRKSGFQFSLTAFGLVLVGIYTLALLPWGAFDSWWYLHSPIPMGWAIVFASVWPVTVFVRPQIIAITAIAFFGMFVTINGSLNYRNFIYEAKVAAQILCEEKKRNSGTKLYSNCAEGSAQMANYLKLEKKCDITVHINHLQESQLQETLSKSPSYVMAYSRKCDAYSKPVPFKYKNEFRFWTIYKNP